MIIDFLIEYLPYVILLLNSVLSVLGYTKSGKCMNFINSEELKEKKALKLKTQIEKKLSKLKNILNETGGKNDES